MHTYISQESGYGEVIEDVKVLQQHLNNLILVRHVQTNSHLYSFECAWKMNLDWRSHRFNPNYFDMKSDFTRSKNWNSNLYWNGKFKFNFVWACRMNSGPIKIKSSRGSRWVMCVCLMCFCVLCLCTWMCSSFRQRYTLDSNMYIYACMHTYIRRHVQTCMQTYVSMHRHGHAWTSTCTDMRILLSDSDTFPKVTYTYVHTYIQKHAHMQLAVRQRYIPESNTYIHT
jgi:hypothetical protein